MLKQVLKTLLQLSGIYTCLLISYGHATPLSKVECEKTLIPVGASESGTTDYPIENDFPGVKVRIHLNGELAIPYSSMAFAKWRRASSASLPDSAFLFHYMTPHQLILHLVRTGNHLDSIALEANPSTLEPTAIPKVGKKRLYLNDQLRVIGLTSLQDILPRLFERSREGYSNIGLQYLIVEFEGLRIPVFRTAPFKIDKFEHRSYEKMLRKDFPSIKILDASYGGIRPYIDPDGKLQVEVSRSNEGGYINFQGALSAANYEKTFLDILTPYLTLNMLQRKDLDSNESVIDPLGDYGFINYLQWIDEANLYLKKATENAPRTHEKDRYAGFGPAETAFPGQRAATEPKDMIYVISRTGDKYSLALKESSDPKGEMAWLFPILRKTNTDILEMGALTHFQARVGDETNRYNPRIVDINLGRRYSFPDAPRSSEEQTELYLRMFLNFTSGYW